MYRIRRFIPKTEQIEIIPIGDIHLGSSNCNIKKLKETINYIVSTPNCYVIGMGDYIDAIPPSDKRFDASQEFNLIDDIYNDLIKILNPIRDRFLLVLTGNHEYKLHSLGFGDPSIRLSREFQVPYGGFSCFFRLETVDKPVKRLVFYLHHGWFAGRNVGSKASNIVNIMRDYSADCYLVGHSHDLFAVSRVRMGWDGAKNVIFGNTGCYMETCSWNTSGYGERAGYPPTKLGSLHIKWFPNKDELKIGE